MDRVNISQLTHTCLFQKVSNTLEFFKESDFGTVETCYLFLISAFVLVYSNSLIHSFVSFMSFNLYNFLLHNAMLLIGTGVMTSYHHTVSS